MTQNLKIELKQLWIKHEYFYSKNSKNIKINQKFLLKLSNKKKEIIIYALKSLLIFDSIKFREIKFFNFHKQFDTIFFVCCEKDILIYMINTTNKKIE